MNTARGYDNFSYLGIFCVGKVPSLLKFMLKMNPSKWYLRSMLLYLSNFFIQLVNIWMSVCNIIYRFLCIFYCELCEMHYCPKSFEGYGVFFLNKTHKPANIYVISTPALSLCLSLFSLSLSWQMRREEGKVMLFVFYQIYHLVW